VTASSLAADSHTHIRPSEDIVYETPKGVSVRDDDDYDVEFLEKDVKKVGRENIGSVTSPYLMSYVYKWRFLNAQYVILKDCDKFKPGYSVVVNDTDVDITIKEKLYRGSKCVWELLTSKYVNKQNATSDDLRTYKKILLITNAHLEGY
jgi:hypothetical protein